MRAALALLLALVAASGCLRGLVDGDPPTPDVPLPARVHLDLHPDAAWLNATLDENRNTLQWTLLEGVDVAASGTMSRRSNTTHSARTDALHGNGTYDVRVHDAGALLGERAFRLASPAWAPARAGTWAFEVDRSGPNTTMRLLGTLRATGDGWRLDAAGSLDERRGEGATEGRVLHYAVEPRGGRAHVTHLVVETTLRAANGSELGVSRVERAFLGVGVAHDSTGAPHAADLHRTWSRLVGVLPSPNGTTPVHAETVTHQWVDRATGAPLRWNATTWDNVTGRTTHAEDFGDGDPAPTILPLWEGALPAPLRPGDRFTLRAGSTEARFEASAEGDGVVANATVTPAGAATLRLDGEGGLVAYEETIARGATSTRVRVGPPA